MVENTNPKNDQSIPNSSPKHVFTIDFKNYIRGVVDLSKGVNEETTIADINSKVSMEGANAWMLMCSIVIASIGLSQNSPAVIIGAMLISPLMSPILGIGASVGVNDMETLRRSLNYFGIAIFIALLTSTIYFEFTPFVGMTDEMESRTHPTFLDIFIAIFGGIAGIISHARKDISTTLPGVAIATALMPPLCVTGYGIASGDWEFASRSFYLFFLNSFFVALATYIIIRLLKFKRKKYINKTRERRGQVMVFLFSVAIMIPSLLIFRGVFRNFKTEISIKKFSRECLAENSIYLDTYSYDKSISHGNTLYLKVYGDAISQADCGLYESCLESLGLKDWKVSVLNSSDVNIDDISLIEKDIQEITKTVKATKNYQLENTSLSFKYAEATIDSATFNAIKDEIHAIYPEIKNLSIAKVQTTNFKKDIYNLPVAIIEWPEMSVTEREKIKVRINDFLEKRLQLDTVRVIML